MVALCTNRFEGFGPHSSIHPSTPTQCFNDVILIPLATWIYIVILVIVFALDRSRSSRNLAYKGSGEQLSSPWRHGFGQRVLAVLYYLLIIGMLAIISVEIARLTVAELGIGLLPFSYVGVLLALLMHIVTRMSRGGSSAVGSRSRRSLRVRCVSAFFWIVLALMMAIAAASAKLEENMGYKRSGQQAMYPVDDVFVDNLTMACVSVVLAGLEFVAS